MVSRFLRFMVYAYPSESNSLSPSRLELAFTILYVTSAVSGDVGCWDGTRSPKDDSSKCGWRMVTAGSRSSYSDSKLSLVLSYTGVPWATFALSFCCTSKQNRFQKNYVQSSSCVDWAHMRQVTSVPASRVTPRQLIHLKKDDVTDERSG